MAKTKTRLIVQIDPAFYDAVKANAKAKDLTVSQVVRHLLREWLKDDPQEEREENQEKD